MHGPRRLVRLPRPRADTDNACEHRPVALGEGGCHVERVQAAIMLWARGDLTRLRDACRLAREDWRDALMRGELAADDWREKLDAELGPHEVTDFETGRRTNVDTYPDVVTLWRPTGQPRYSCHDERRR